MTPPLRNAVLIRSHVTCLNQHGDLVALGDHPLKVFPEEKTP